MFEEGAAVEELVRSETKLNRTVLRMLALRALLKACEAADAASGNVLESISTGRAR